jgi:hypothetical protein
MHRLDSELARMIQATRASDGPVPEDRARIGKQLAARLGDPALLAAIAAAPAALSAGKAVAATGAAGSALLGGAKVAGVVILVAGVVVAVPQSRRVILRALGAMPATEVKLERPAPAQQPPSAPAPEPVLAEAPVQAEVSAMAPAPVARSGARSAMSGPRPRTASSVPPVATLQREAKLLQQAQQALRDGRPALALATLGEHDREFGPGALHEEAQAARVMALCALGRPDEAAEVARVFLRQSPRSPLAAQVRGSCAVEAKR